MLAARACELVPSQAPVAWSMGHESRGYVAVDIPYLTLRTGYW